MSFFIFFLVIIAVLSGLIRYSARFRAWRIGEQPHVCWAILLNTMMVTLYTGWLWADISLEVSAGFTFGAALIGALSGEIAREMLAQASRGARWSTQQLARLLPLIVLGFVGFYTLQNPEIIRDPMALAIAVGGLAIILGWRPGRRRR